MNVDPNSLLPKLPKPQDLQPFPSAPSVVCSGCLPLSVLRNDAKMAVAMLAVVSQSLALLDIPRTHGQRHHAQPRPYWAVAGHWQRRQDRARVGGTQIAMLSAAETFSSVCVCVCALVAVFCIAHAGWGVLQVMTGRCVKVVTVEAEVNMVAWCPNASVGLIAVAAGLRWVGDGVWIAQPC